MSGIEPKERCSEDIKNKMTRISDYILTNLMKKKVIDDIYLEKTSHDFIFGTIREGMKHPKSDDEMKYKVLTYIVSRDNLDDEDIDTIREKVQELGEVENENIVIPEKVMITSSNVYFVFPLNREKPFIEAYKEKMIQVPQFLETIVDSISHLKAKDLTPIEVLPETLRFDRKGDFELHDLNCDFLLKKKFVTEKLKDRKGSKVLKVHAPEVVNKIQSKKIDPEKSLVYSMGVLFKEVAEKKVETEAGPTTMTKKCQNFLEKMCSKVAAERPELDEVLDFKWNKIMSKSVSFDPEVKGKSSSDKDPNAKKWKSKEEFKQGKFTDEEVETLKHSVCRYVQEQGWGEAGLVKLITHYKDKDVKGAWTKIAECLPDRSVQSCHQLIRNRFHPHNYKGAWSEDDEKELTRLVNERGEKWQSIAEELGRTPTNVKDKWKSMGDNNYQSRKKGHWKPDEIIKLFRIIENITGTKVLSDGAEEWVREESNRERQNPNQDGSVRRKKDAFTKIFESRLCDFIDYDEAKNLNYMKLPWKKIADQMKERSNDDCRNIWYRQIYNTIASGCDFTDEEDEILINTISGQDPSNEHDIDFSEIDNGRSLKENEMRWKQLSKAASSRALRTTSELIKMVRKYVRKMNRAPIGVVQKESNNNALLRLFRTEYQD